MDGCYVSCLIATVLWSVWIRPRNHHPARFFDLLASSNCYFSCHQNTFHEFDNVKRIQDLTSQMAIFIYKMTSNRLFSVHFYNSCQPFSFHCLFLFFVNPWSSICQAPLWLLFALSKRIDILISIHNQKIFGFRQKQDVECPCICR